MRKTLFMAALAFAAIGSARAQPDVGVSIGIHQPGVYGRVDIGNQPPPPVVLAQPVIVAPPRVAVQREPVYLYVPPAHRLHWREYCRRYEACGRPVYFVDERWVRERWEHERWQRERWEREHRHHDERGDRHRGHPRDRGEWEHRR